MTVPATNEGGVVVMLAIGLQVSARAGPEDRNLVEKVVMVLHCSEFSDAPSLLKLDVNLSLILAATRSRAYRHSAIGRSLSSAG
jgi:hypothetical protein